MVIHCCVYVWALLGCCRARNGLGSLVGWFISWVSSIVLLCFRGLESYWGGAVFYLAYTIFTSFLLRYTTPIVSYKAVARARHWGYARRCSWYYTTIYFFLTDQLVHGGASRAIRNLRERLSSGAIFVGSLLLHFYLVWCTCYTSILLLLLLFFYSIS